MKEMKKREENAHSTSCQSQKQGPNYKLLRVFRYENEDARTLRNVSTDPLRVTLPAQDFLRL